MANMSYCMFENTFKDLEMCYDAISNGDTLSSSEAKYKERLIQLCREIVEIAEEDFND